MCTLNYSAVLLAEPCLSRMILSIPTKLAAHQFFENSPVHLAKAHPEEPHDIEIPRPAEDVVLEPSQHPTHHPAQSAKPRKHQQDDEQGETRIFVSHLGDSQYTQACRGKCRAF